MAFPSTLSTFNRPNPTDRLNNPSHSALHNTVSSALGQVEAVIGVDGISSVVGTMMYDLRSPASKGGGHVQGAAFGGTGQTTFTKGDILVAQSASVLTKLAVGTDTYLLRSDSTQATGISWAAPTASTLGISSPTVKVTTVSSVWSKPSGLSYISVELVGGGGGGGGADNDFGAGGGGASGYARKIIVVGSLGATENIVVAAGGTAGSGTNGTNGGAGGTTGFGAPSILYAAGGNGGVGGGGGGGNGSGGGGSVGIGGNINITGGYGATGAGATGSHTGGSGGSGYFGGGGVGGILDNPGVLGQAYGSGGGGAAEDDSVGQDGGVGAGGIVIITEYYA